MSVSLIQTIIWFQNAFLIEINQFFSQLGIIKCSFFFFFPAFKQKNRKQGSDHISNKVLRPFSVYISFRKMFFASKHP